MTTITGLPRRAPAEGRTEFGGELYSYSERNKGEFGGALSVHRDRRPARILVRENVIDMIPQGDDLYVFTCADHLGLDDGSVQRTLSR